MPNIKKPKDVTVMDAFTRSLWKRNMPFRVVTNDNGTLTIDTGVGLSAVFTAEGELIETHSKLAKPESIDYGGSL